MCRRRLCQHQPIAAGERLDKKKRKKELALTLETVRQPSTSSERGGRRSVNKVIPSRQVWPSGKLLGLHTHPTDMLSLGSNLGFQSPFS